MRNLLSIVFGLAAFAAMLATDKDARREFMRDFGYSEE